MSATQQDFEVMVGRLSRLSVERHFDAYADIAWDDPALAVDPADPRLELPDVDPLRHTGWYAAQPAERRAAIGCYRWAACMKTGWHFENLLQRGLLRHAFELRNGAPEFRYLHHEIIEESQHTLMFQEFVNRSGLPVRGMPWGLRKLAEWFVIPLARLFPTLFFLFVLGGEDPVDHLQRRVLADPDRAPHPLVERIMRIHTTEEARHLSFARKYLQRRVPDLSRWRRLHLALHAPIVLGVMARLMLWPSGDLVRHFGVPGDVVRAANRSPQGRQLLKDSVAKTRRLFIELGLVTPAAKLAWRAAGLWDSRDAR
ncbi:MAG TPA: diiron oxygenase [Acidimicrobiia bacterium]|nr:diiron oxygenase [Acidimicrobiia bacterium]